MKKAPVVGVTAVRFGRTAAFALHLKPTFLSLELLQARNALHFNSAVPLASSAE
jgi:hypothetical protein